jgi:aryl-alcohol dehydrogenase-like predicted oxidoreductase
MIYRNLGRSGLKVSAISIGAWVGFGNRIDDDAAFAIMKAAYDSGINFFDNVSPITSIHRHSSEYAAMSDA